MRKTCWSEEPCDNSRSEEQGIWCLVVFKDGGQVYFPATCIMSRYRIPYWKNSDQDGTWFQHRNLKSGSIEIFVVRPEESSMVSIRDGIVPNGCEDCAEGDGRVAPKHLFSKCFSEERRYSMSRHPNAI